MLNKEFSSKPKLIIKYRSILKWQIQLGIWSFRDTTFFVQFWCQSFPKFSHPHLLQNSNINAFSSVTQLLAGLEETCNREFLMSEILNYLKKDNSGVDSQNAFWKTRVLKLMSSRFFWCSNHVLFYSYYLDMHNWNVWLRNHHSMTRLNQSWWVLYAQSMEKHSCRNLWLFS